MRILVAGGTGFVGSALVQSLLDDGHDVTVLGRDAGRIRARFAGRASAITWGTPDVSTLSRDMSGHEVVFNLTGEQAVGTRYTPGHKERIRDSRVKTTRALVQAFDDARGTGSGDAAGSALSRPRVLISASAVGFYGARTPGESIDERAQVGTGFLAELCHEWEEAALRAELRGVRVVIARLGVVLGPGGGAFESIARPFRLGVGGPIGDGAQDMSFISLADCVRALKFCMEPNHGLRGPVNLTAPAPTNGLALATAISRVLEKPNWLPVPKFALRALYGEGAEALVTGQRVLPTVLLNAGFQFRHPTIDLAVASAAVKPPVK